MTASDHEDIVVADDDDVRVAAASRTSGLVAIGFAVLAFSLGSTLVKLAETPGVTIAFWRMVVCSFTWAVIMRVLDGRWLTLADLRAALAPGVVFGLNITLFFTGVTKTSVAHAEFIGAVLTPFILIPAGAMMFRERVNPRALLFGLISVAGLGLVLGFSPAGGDASVTGDLIIAAAVVCWASYLIVSRQLRIGRSVATVMASITPVATVTILPLVLASGNVTAVTWRSLVFTLILAVVTGTAAHGFIVFAQRTVPVGTISIMQVAQPALAVLWSVLLLSQSVRPIQLVGMALVMVGLIAVTLSSRRG
jgi:drug/metabolite transporter (DMT)-like permease